MNPQEVLAFWIGAAAHDPAAAKIQSKRWYKSTAADDAAMGKQFGKTLQLAEQGKLAEWRSTTRGQLALVILLDQLSRNIYRGTAKAFANDAQALTIAAEIIDADQHQCLSPIEQVFLFHPFEHAENLAAQQRAVKLFSELRAKAPQDWHEQLQRFLDFARLHQTIIATYGRFPHRNNVLGRQNTPTESDYLIKGTRFGQ